MGFGIEELQAVERVMKSGCLSGYQGNWTEQFYGGQEVQALEREWAEHFGVKHAVACNSATSGLWMALNAIGLKKNDAVFVTPYSMTCSASMPLLFGTKPVFVDIEKDYFCMDAISLELKILKVLEDNQYIELGYEEGEILNPRAIIVVDLFGQPYNADRINAIAKKYNLIVIEDAAQAPGATYKGKYTGTLGDIGVYSLNRHKHIHCGEGGMCVTNDDELDMKLRLSMNHAEAVCNDMERMVNPHENLPIEFYIPDYEKLVPMVGMNLRMTELSAAIAREQLKKLPDILAKYREDAKYFPVKVRPECKHSYYRYATTEKTIMEYCSNENIEDKFEFKKGYIKPIFQMPLFRNLGYDQEQCPVVRAVNDNIILALRREPY